MFIRRYSELCSFVTIGERYEYLRLKAKVGDETFGFDKYLNQGFYHSKEWKRIRDLVIARDFGCELGLSECPIVGKIIVHHMNPITIDDLRLSDGKVFDPEFLVCCSEDMHNAIHFGDKSLLPGLPVERKPGDTRSW